MPENMKELLEAHTRALMRQITIVQNNIGPMRRDQEEPRPPRPAGEAEANILPDMPLRTVKELGKLEALLRREVRAQNAFVSTP